MSRGALRRFYHSPEWKRVRRLYLMSQDYVCERCGQPAVIVHHRDHLHEGDAEDLEKLLGFDNLEALCFECHNREHFGGRCTRDGVAFDSNGNLVVTATDGRCGQGQA